MPTITEILAPSRAISTLTRAGYHLMEQPGALYVDMASGKTGRTPWGLDASMILLTAYIDILQELWPGHGGHR